MLNEHMGSSCNHFGSSWATSTSPLRGSVAAHGDHFTGLCDLHTTSNPNKCTHNLRAISTKIEIILSAPSVQIEN